MKTLMLAALCLLSTSIFAQFSQLDPIPENFERIMETIKFSTITEDDHTFHYGLANGYYDGVNWRNHGKVIFSTNIDDLNYNSYTRQLYTLITANDPRLDAKVMGKNSKVTATFKDGVPNGKILMINQETGKKTFEGTYTAYIDETGKLTYKPQGKISSWHAQTGKPLSSKHYDENGKLIKMTKYEINKGVTEITKIDGVQLKTQRWQVKGKWNRRCIDYPVNIEYNEFDKKFTFSLNVLEKNTLNALNELLHKKVSPLIIENELIQNAFTKMSSDDFIDKADLCKDIMAEIKTVVLAELERTKDLGLENCSQLIAKCDETTETCHNAINETELQINKLNNLILVEKQFSKTNWFYPLYDLFVETEADLAEEALPAEYKKLEALTKKSETYMAILDSAKKLKQSYENSVSECSQNVDPGRYLTAKDIETFKVLNSSIDNYNDQFDATKKNAIKAKIIQE